MRAPRTLQTALVALAFGFGLAACGTDEYSPSAPKDGEPSPEEPFLGYVDPGDTATTSIGLTTSAEYDADQNLARIYAMVRDQDGTPLTTLNKDNFSLTLTSPSASGAVPSDSVSFATEASAEEVVALVLDSSGSMSASANPGDPNDPTTRLQAGQAAARSFVENMGSGRAAVVTFNTDARTVQPLTDDQELLFNAIGSLAANGATNFGAAVGEAVRAVGTRPGKRAMILLTDGDDTSDPVTGDPTVWLTNPTSSRYQGLKLAKENSFRIYTVSLGSDISDVGTADLQTFAAETGGQYFAAPTTASLATAFGVTIPDEISRLEPITTYVLSFVNPVSPRSGRAVSYRASVFYEGANGWFFDKSPGTYLFP